MSASKGNIVVVEDDPAMRLALGRFLKACGFRAQGFDSAEELLEDGAAANASCLIVDIHLTGLSGFELLKELRKRGTERPTIFITADEDSSLPSRYPKAAGFLTKPFVGARLLAAIREALEVSVESKVSL